MRQATMSRQVNLRRVAQNDTQQHEDAPRRLLFTARGAARNSRARFACSRISFFKTESTRKHGSNSDSVLLKTESVVRAARAFGNDQYVGTRFVKAVLM